MSKKGPEQQESKEESLQFLIKTGLPPYLNIFEQILLRGVNHQFEKVYSVEVIKSYIRRFGTFQGFKLIITILRDQNKPEKLSMDKFYIRNRKLFKFMSSVMQLMLIEKIKTIPKASLHVWQLIACITPLRTENSISLYEEKEEKKLNIVSLLNSHQKLSFVKSLFKLVATSSELKNYISEDKINYITLQCIKNNLNSLLELLLRLNIGSWYNQEYLLTEENPENQHPLLACFDADNLTAFRFFLIYAEHLLRIYHRYSSIPSTSPPMNNAALRGKHLFIELIAQQKPEYLDELDYCKDNIAHTILSPYLYPSYEDDHLRKTISILIQYRPALFSVKNIHEITPKDLLPKKFFAEPQVKL